MPGVENCVFRHFFHHFLRFFPARLWTPLCLTNYSSWFNCRGFPSVKHKPLLKSLSAFCAFFQFIKSCLSSFHLCVTEYLARAIVLNKMLLRKRKTISLHWSSYNKINVFQKVNCFIAFRGKKGLKAKQSGLTEHWGGKEKGLWISSFFQSVIITTASFMVVENGKRTGYQSGTNSVRKVGMRLEEVI